MKNVYISHPFDNQDDLCDFLTDHDIAPGNIVSIVWNGKFILIVRKAYREETD